MSENIKRIHEGHNDANFDLLAKSLLLSGKNQVDALNQIAAAVTTAGSEVDPAIIVELQEAVKELELKVDSIEAYDDTELKETLEKLQTQIDGLEAYDDTELKETLATLQSQIDGLEAYDDTELKETLATLQSQIDGLEAYDDTELKETLATLQSQIDSIEAYDDSELKETLATLQSQIDGLEAYDDTELKSTLTSLQELVESASTKADEAKAVADNASGMIEDIDEILKDVQPKVDTLESSVEILETKVSELGPYRLISAIGSIDGGVNVTQRVDFTAGLMCVAYASETTSVGRTMYNAIVEILDELGIDYTKYTDSMMVSFGNATPLTAYVISPSEVRLWNIEYSDNGMYQSEMWYPIEEFLDLCMQNQIKADVSLLYFAMTASGDVPTGLDDMSFYFNIFYKED